MTHNEFYKSRSWRRVRKAYIDYRMAIDGGICEVCREEPGKIVHHKVWLNNENCNDVDISLNPHNLRYECQTCHNKERNPEAITAGRCLYGENGEIIRNTHY